MCRASVFANLHLKSRGRSKETGEDGSTGGTWHLHIKLSHGALDQDVDA